MRLLPGPAAPQEPSRDVVRDDDPGADIRELVARAQTGDAEAFGQIYDRYSTLVYRYVYYRVGSVSVAEDITSETFLRALRGLRSFSWQGRDIGAWFVTIARNLITDHVKSSRYRLEVPTADMRTAHDSAHDQTTDGEVLDHLTNEALFTALKKLRPEQQECVVLRFMQGLSVRETGLVMGKNDGAIKSLQYRAIRNLGQLLPDGIA